MGALYEHIFCPLCKKTRKIILMEGKTQIFKTEFLETFSLPIKIVAILNRTLDVYFPSTDKKYYLISPSFTEHSDVKLMLNLHSPFWNILL